MKPNRITWYPDEIYFLKKNFFQMTNGELLDHINSRRSEKIHLSSMIYKCRSMGLQREIQIRWSEEDIQYLIKKFRKCGDTELAMKFNRRKKTFRIIDGERVYREFTKKHVEKKRNLLDLKRTPDEILAIKRRNRAIGLDTGGFTSDNNLWSRGDRKKVQEGETHIQRNKHLQVKMVKVGGILTPYSRWIYQKKVRPLLDSEYVKHKDLDKTNCDISNLYISTNKSINSRERIAGINILGKRIESIQSALKECESKQQETTHMKELSRLRNLIRHYSKSKRYPISGRSIGMSNVKLKKAI